MNEKELLQELVQSVKNIQADMQKQIRSMTLSMLIHPGSISNPDLKHHQEAWRSSTIKL